MHRRNTGKIFSRGHNSKKNFSGNFRKSEGFGRSLEQHSINIKCFTRHQLSPFNLANSKHIWFYLSQSSKKRGLEEREKEVDKKSIEKNKHCTTPGSTGVQLIEIPRGRRVKTHVCLMSWVKYPLALWALPPAGTSSHLTILRLDRGSRRGMWNIDSSVSGIGGHCGVGYSWNVLS